MLVEINNELCIGCGLCGRDCPASNIRVEEKKAVFHEEERCIVCGHCIAVCPKNAVKITKYDDNTVYDAVMAEVCPTPKELMDFLRARRSIRHYKKKSVEKNVLNELMAVGRYSPTGGNRQGTRFIVVQDQLEGMKQMAWETLNNMADMGLSGAINSSLIKYYAPVWKNYYKRWKKDDKDDPLFLGAPVLFVIESESLLDAGIAAAYMDLMANTMGLGMLYNGFLMQVLQFNADFAKELGVRNPQNAVCMLAGYPDVRYYRTVPRKAPEIIWR